MNINSACEKPVKVGSKLDKAESTNLLVLSGLKGDYSDFSLPFDYDRREEIVQKRMKDKRFRLGLNLLRRIPQVILAGGLIFGGGKMVADSGVIQNALNNAGARVSEVVPSQDINKNQQVVVTDTGEEWKAPGEETVGFTTEIAEVNEAENSQGYLLIGESKLKITEREKVELGEIKLVEGVATVKPEVLEKVRDTTKIEKLEVMTETGPVVLFRIEMNLISGEGYYGDFSFIFSGFNEYGEGENCKVRTSGMMSQDIFNICQNGECPIREEQGGEVSRKTAVYLGTSRAIDKLGLDRLSGVHSWEIYFSGKSYTTTHLATNYGSIGWGTQMLPDGLKLEKVEVAIQGVSKDINGQEYYPEHKWANYSISAQE